MTIIDRLARQPIGRLAVAIVASAMIALIALVISVRTATNQSSVARREAQRAISQSQANSAKLFETVCQIADSQRLHPEDPTEPKPSTARGVRSAQLWGTLYLQQGCSRDNAQQPGVPSSSPAPLPTLAPSPTP